METWVTGKKKMEKALENRRCNGKRKVSLRKKKWLGTLAKMNEIYIKQAYYLNC